jgi:hypothetical protein
VTAFTFAVLDVPKDEELANDTHGSKVIVIPFDGAAFDRDMEKLAAAERAGQSTRPQSPDKL